MSNLERAKISEELERYQEDLEENLNKLKDFLVTWNEKEHKNYEVFLFLKEVLKTPIKDLEDEGRPLSVVIMRNTIGVKNLDLKKYFSNEDLRNTEITVLQILDSVLKSKKNLEFLGEKQEKAVQYHHLNKIKQIFSLFQANTAKTDKNLTKKMIYQIISFYFIKREHLVPVTNQDKRRNIKTSNVLSDRFISKDETDFDPNILKENERIKHSQENFEKQSQENSSVITKIEEDSAENISEQTETKKFKGKLLNTFRGLRSAFNLIREKTQKEDLTEEEKEILARQKERLEKVKEISSKTHQIFKKGVSDKKTGTVLTPEEENQLFTESLKELEEGQFIDFELKKINEFVNFLQEENTKLAKKLEKAFKVLENSLKNLREQKLLYIETFYKAKFYPEILLKTQRENFEKAIDNFNMTFLRVILLQTSFDLDLRNTVKKLLNPKENKVLEKDEMLSNLDDLISLYKINDLRDNLREKRKKFEEAEHNQKEDLNSEILFLQKKFLKQKIELEELKQIREVLSDFLWEKDDSLKTAEKEVGVLFKIKVKDVENLQNPETENILSNIEKIRTNFDRFDLNNSKDFVYGEDKLKKIIAKRKKPSKKGTKEKTRDQEKQNPEIIIEKKSGEKTSNNNEVEVIPDYVRSEDEENKKCKGFNLEDLDGKKGDLSDDIELELE
jgi:hypothetical protein